MLKSKNKLNGISRPVYKNWKKYILICIDMQPSFDACQRWVIDECSVLVEDAIKKKLPIVYVKYDGNGPIALQLNKLIKNYNNYSEVIKDRISGAEPLSEYINNNHPGIQKLLVCGVQTAVCVLETVRGLSTKYPNKTIFVREAACNDPFDHFDAIETLKKIENVTII